MDIEHENNLPHQKKCEDEKNAHHMERRQKKEKKKKKKKHVKRKVPSTITRHPYRITMGKHCCIRSIKATLQLHDDFRRYESRTSLVGDT